MLPVRATRPLFKFRSATNAPELLLARSFASSGRLAQEVDPPPRPEVKFDLPKYVSEPGGAAHVPKVRSKVVRDLPPVKSKTLQYTALFLSMCGCWYAYALFAHNRERGTSTGFRYATRVVRDHPAAQQALGGTVRLEASIVGDPWIDGTINTLQGKYDITFRVKGALRSGTVYFTSVRRHKGEKFEVIRFALVPDRRGKAGSIDDEDHVISLLEDGGHIMED